MKQLLILSGKGGTGKTTVAGAFIKLSQAKAYADCDVDAPNLHLIFNHNSNPSTSNYYGFPKAFIKNSLCTQCGLCFNNCRFEAIILKDKNYKVENLSCEGCGVCVAICPVNAIEMKPAVSGEVKVFKNNDTLFSTAKLKIGSGNSGKLVSEVKKQLENSKAKIAVIDGSPGIGCPVIASLRGTDLTLIVAEPSVSGIFDMKRIIKTAEIFGIPSLVCINKYDTNLNKTEEIKAFCKKNNIPFMGTIPFDKEVVNATNTGKSITEVQSQAGKAIKDIFSKVMKHLDKK